MCPVDLFQKQCRSNDKYLSPIFYCTHTNLRCKGNKKSSTIHWTPWEGEIDRILRTVVKEISGPWLSKALYAGQRANSLDWKRKVGRTGREVSKRKAEVVGDLMHWTSCNRFTVLLTMWEKICFCQKIHTITNYRKVIMTN